MDCEPWEPCMRQRYPRASTLLRYSHHHERQGLSPWPMGRSQRRLTDSDRPAACQQAMEGLSCFFFCFFGPSDPIQVPRDTTCPSM